MMEPKGRLSERDIPAVIEIAAGKGATRPPRRRRIRSAHDRPYPVHRDQRLPTTGEVERHYSSDPAAYAVSGHKQKRDTPWAASCSMRARSSSRATAVSARHVLRSRLIASLGIAEIMNVPIPVCGQTLRAINLCGEASRSAEAEFRPKLIAGLLVPAVMADTIP